MRKLLLLFLGSLFCMSVYGQCPSTPITLSSQADVDAFVTNYPNCTELESELIISGNDIIDLSPLSIITQVGTSFSSFGGLTIINNPQLENLNGLENIQDVFSGSITIENNPQLLSIEGLSGLSGQLNAHSLIIKDNPLLISLEGLHNINSPGDDDLIIWNNDSLLNLSGIEALNSADDILIWDNDSMTNFFGGSILNTGTLSIKDNDALETLGGIGNVQTLFELEIVNNPQLRSITGIAFGTIEAGSGGVTITDNPLLWACSVTSICDFLDNGGIATISNNATGCNNAVEVQTNCSDCPPAPVFFTSQAQIDNFAINYPNCTNMPLGMRIEGASITNLTGLSQLENLNHVLMILSTSITNLTGLENLRLENGVSLSISGNDNLIGISNFLSPTPTNIFLNFGANQSLTSLSGMPLYTELSRLSVHNNDALLNLEGFPLLQSLGSLSITDNDLLVDLNGMEALQETISIRLNDNNNLLSVDGLQNITLTWPTDSNGLIEIHNNPQLGSLSGLLAPVQDRRVSLSVEDNSGLVSLDGLNSLVDFTLLEIRNNDSLQDLTGLEGAQSVIHEFRIFENDQMTSVNGLQNVVFGLPDSSLSPFAIENNAQLSSLEGISAPNSKGLVIVQNCPLLTNLDGLEGFNSILRLWLINNDLLSDISALESVTEIGQFMSLIGNPSLQSLDGLQNVVYGDDDPSTLTHLNLQNNPVLEDISAIANYDFSLINDPGEFFQIINNTSLSSCAIESVCDFLDSGTDASVLIQDNGPGCSDGAEIINACNLALNVVSGQVVYDFDDNGCDPDDYECVSVLIETTDGTDSFGTFTSILGQYQNYIDIEGTVTTSIAEASIPPFFEVAPESAESVFIGFGNEDVVDFCLTTTQTVNDLKVTLLPLDDAVLGQDSNYAIVYENLGTAVSLTAEVTLTFDLPRQTFVNAIPAETSIAGNTITWDVAGLPPLQSGVILVRMNTLLPPANEIGDVIIMQAELVEDEGDESPVDNISILEQTIVGDSLTNDLVVIQGPEIYEDYVGEYLSYIVRFQNLGTIEAAQVIINNTLSDNLDWKTIRPLASSHPFRAQILNGNEVSFVFEDINLPPVSDNPEESKGYIAFQVRTLNSLEVGDTVESLANITFGEDDPITTNLVTTTVVENLGVDENHLSRAIKLIPNPVSQKLKIITENYLEVTDVQVHSVLGELLFFSEEVELDFTALPTGMYFITIKTDQGTITKKVMKE